MEKSVYIMGETNYLKPISALLITALLCGTFSGCRKVKSHKEYVNSEYEVVFSNPSSSDETDASSDSSETYISSSGSGSSSTTAGSSFSGGGVISTGKRITLEYSDSFIFGEHPTFYWSAPTNGQKVNISLYDSAGKVVFNKKGLTGTSYKCEPTLEDGKTYILRMTFTNSDGSERVVNNVGENGKKMRCIAKRADANGKKYDFNGSVSLEVLNNYLSRALTYNMYTNDSGYNGNKLDESIRFITNTGAKYIQRAASEWYPESKLESNSEALKAKLAAAHSVDPDIVFEACIFETSGLSMNSIPIPAWVFEAFGKKAENRNFNADLTKFSSGYGVDHWAKNYHVPDVTQLETQMFIYYRACTYINMGFEALHLGQVKMTGKNDTNNATYTKLIGMIRDYAKKHARRGYVFINAHNNNFTSPDGKMLVDMIVAPTRVHAAAGEVDHEVSENNPQKCDIEPGYWEDSVYQSGISGTSPSGWYAEKYPYLVEFDNYGGVLGDTSDRTSYVWGRDEITWYVSQPDWYRREFMSFLINKINGYDENGHVALVGHRGGKFYANNKSTLCENGSGDEETIKAIFEKK